MIRSLLSGFCLKSMIKSIQSGIFGGGGGVGVIEK